MSRSPSGPGPRNRVLAWLWDGVVMLAVWRGGGLRGRPAPPAQAGPPPDPSEREVGTSAGAVWTVVALFGLCGCCGLAFALLMILDADTQLLGLTAGLGLVSFGAAMASASAFVVPRETRVERREIFERHTEAGDEVIERLKGGVDGVTRRRLLGAAAGAAGAGLGAAAVIPVVSLGPGLTNQLNTSPYHHGTRLVDDSGAPIAAAAVPIGAFIPAFPEGVDRDLLGSPVVVVRVPPRMLDLPRGRRHWAPLGIMAYSKICTHAGCAISLFRAPLSPSTRPRNYALVCPCHYSTFDVLDGGSVTFGPAGRALPQLPLMVDTAGNLRARGGFSGQIGPSWWGNPR